MSDISRSTELFYRKERKIYRKVRKVIIALFAYS